MEVCKRESSENNLEIDRGRGSKEELLYQGEAQKTLFYEYTYMSINTKENTAIITTTTAKSIRTRLTKLIFMESSILHGCRLELLEITITQELSTMDILYIDSTNAPMINDQQ